MGRCHDARAEWALTGLAHRPELACLQHPQKLRLVLERQLRDLVEKDCALTRLFEEAGFSAHSARERAAGVPEELALDQVPRQTRHVDRHERVCGAARAAVERASGDLFASPRLTREQNVLVGLGESVNHGAQAPHGLGRPHQSVCRPTDPLGGLPKRRLKGVRIDGLHQERVRAKTHRLDGVGHCPVASEHDDRRAPPGGQAQHIEPAQLGHPQVEDDHVGLDDAFSGLVVGAQARDRNARITERLNDMPFPTQRLGQRKAKALVVIDDQDTQRPLRGHHSEPPIAGPRARAMAAFSATSLKKAVRSAGLRRLPARRSNACMARTER